MQLIAPQKTNANDLFANALDSVLNPSSTRGQTLDQNINTMTSDIGKTLVQSQNTQDAYAEQINSYNQDIKNSQAQLSFNMNVLGVNQQEFQDQWQQNVNSTIGQEQGKSASSGFSVTSGSFLTNFAHTLDLANQQLSNYNTSIDFKRQALNFEENLQQQGYQSYIQKVQKESAYATYNTQQQVGNMTKQLGTLQDQQFQLHNQSVQQWSDQAMASLEGTK